MNLHEYQSKSILKTFGVKIQEGLVATSADEAVEAAKKLQEETGTGWWVIKAQIHAGGRGKGKIVGTEQRGVALAKSIDDVRTIAENILGNVLVTLQTGEAGKQVNKILIAQD
ncbi:MAG TPA: succinate--CoA ligase subunit beta, partial [Flavobacteriales bacterium]|nr:succinate--CoA ligase subunit beta [Flavobacteriales bacterium]